MSRLTYKELMSGYYPNEDILDTDCFDKLGKLEDLEDELGCTLEVVFKALKERYIIFKHVVGVDNPIIKLKTHRVLGLICIGEKLELELSDGVFGDEFYVDTKDYGKTWWLKSDRSEDNE